jgi:hypothetical protein
MKHCHVYEWLLTGSGLVNRFIDHLRAVSTITITLAISTLYSSLEHTV